MANYLLIYHPNPDAGAGGDMGPPTDEEMAAWGAWFESLGEAVVDGGNPISHAMTLTPTGVSDGGGVNPATGYSMISANDMDAALAHAKGCPIIAGGGSIEVCAVLDLG